MMYNRKLVFWSACLGMLLFGITLITLGSVAPDLKEKLALDDIASGTLFSILPLGILAGSVIFGPLADRYGFKVLMSVSCFLLAIGFEGIAWSGNAGILKFFIFFIGISGGAVNGATNSLVSDISEDDKGAKLSLLGAFFGIGALGMPLVLGFLGKSTGFEKIVSAVGILSFVVAILFAVIKMPPPKLAKGIKASVTLSLFRDTTLLFIAFYLFLQSSFEGIINNWTTTFIIDHLSAPQNYALYGLSMYVAGMVAMRLLNGVFLRNTGVKRILTVSFVLILLGLVLIKTGFFLVASLTGFMILGAGLASGFPVMLGFVGDRYTELSGTAFSFVLAAGLIGNMLLNYLMGIISQNLGIEHLVTVAFAETIVMIVLVIIILRKIKNKVNHVGNTMA